MEAQRGQGAKKMMTRRFFGYRSFMPEYEAMKRFRKAGVDTVTVMLSNGVTSSGDPYTAFQPIWLAEEKYDYDMIDKQIDGVINAVPDVQLIFYIDLNPPAWWYRRYNWRCDPFHQLGRLAADPQWRTETAEYLTAVLTHIEEKYPDRVGAYICTGGGTTEWFDYSDGEESRSKIAAYKEWCAKKGYPVPADIPPRSVRDDCPRGKEVLAAMLKPVKVSKWRTGAIVPQADGNGLFRTPQDNPEAVRYWQFCNELVSDTALYFAKVARKVIRKEIPLGTTFGNMVDGSPASRGQSDMLRVYDAPELDFIVAPISYNDRNMGGGTGSQITVEALRVRGKRMLNSCDILTYTSRNLRPYDRWRPMWKDDAEVAAGMKREFSYNFIAGASTWWFDMMGGWWDSPGAMATLRLVKPVWDKYCSEYPDQAYETLVLYQPGNGIYLNKRHPATTGFFAKTLRAANRCGRPVGYGILEDLDRMDVSHVRCFVLPLAFHFSEKEERILREKVCRPGNTVIWLYGPGVIDRDGKWNEAAVKQWCGVPFGTPGAVEKTMPDGWTSVCIHDPEDLTPKLFIGILDRAQVHRWCDKDRPVFANAHFAAVHTGEAEVLQLAFPAECREVEDLFTGETWHDVQTLELKSTGPDTRLFRYETK